MELQPVLPGVAQGAPFVLFRVGEVLLVSAVIVACHDHSTTRIIRGLVGLRDTPRE